MRRIFASALVVGLIAVPSAALALRGTDNPTTSTTPIAHQVTSVRGEAEQEDQHAAITADTNASSSVTANVTSISLNDAKALAQSHFPDKTIIKVEAETEHGVQVFSVSFSDGSRVDVTLSGNIVVSENETNQSDENHSNSVRVHVEDELHTVTNISEVHGIHERD